MTDDKIVFRPVRKGMEHLIRLGSDIKANKDDPALSEGAAVFDEIHDLIAVKQHLGMAVTSIEIDRDRALKLVRMGLWAKRMEQLEKDRSDGWYDHEAQRVMRNYRLACESGTPLSKIGPIPVFVSDSDIPMIDMKVQRAHGK